MPIGNASSAPRARENTRACRDRSGCGLSAPRACLPVRIQALDPELEYAREGMLEALKARNPIYRGMLAYFLWLGVQSSRFQWAFIVAVFFGGRITRALSESQPDMKWLWWPLLGLF